VIKKWGEWEGVRGGAGKEALPFYIHKKWKLREVEIMDDPLYLNI